MPQWIDGSVVPHPLITSTKKPIALVLGCISQQKIPLGWALSQVGVGKGEREGKGEKAEERERKGKKGKEKKGKERENERETPSPMKEI